jgi:hypothetical protein
MPLDEFIAAFGEGYCRRVYDCCRPEDRAVASPGTDEATCAAAMTKNARDNADFLLSVSGIAYDGVAARRCLDLLADGPCAAIWSPHFAAIIVCQDVFPGIGALGAACEDQRQCASGTCGGVCVEAATCGAGSVVDFDNGCQPLVGLMGPCTVTVQCPTGAACITGVCKARNPNGAPCQTADECAGTCAPEGDGGAYVCRPDYCTGQ